MTGILPIAIEDATKSLQALLTAGKEYICVMRLHAEVPKDRLISVLKEFQGALYQRPPLRSSVKRRLRIRTVYYLRFLEMLEKRVLFKVGCEAGTYIRKLCFDVGEVLGCGAHMIELRRTRVGPFVENARLVTLHDLSYRFSRWQETKDERFIRSFVFPMEKALEFLPKIVIRDSAINAICHGAHLAAPGVLSVDSKIHTDDSVAIFSQKGEAVALAKALESSERILEMDHGLITKTHRVLMPRNLYPKMWR